VQNNAHTIVLGVVQHDICKLELDVPVCEQNGVLLEVLSCQLSCHCKAAAVDLVHGQRKKDSRPDSNTCSLKSTTWE
jgi:hypothetical protein